MLLRVHVSGNGAADCSSLQSCERRLYKRLLTDGGPASHTQSEQRCSRSAHEQAYAGAMERIRSCELQLTFLARMCQLRVTRHTNGRRVTKLLL